MYITVSYLSTGWCIVHNKFTTHIPNCNTPYQGVPESARNRGL